MYRLGALTEQQKSRYGWTALVVGFVAIVLGVFIIHWAHFPQTRIVNGVEQPVVVDYFNWMPRGWFPKSIGYIVAFGGSQLMLGGAILAFVLGRPMTWSRAAFTAFLAWVELVLIFGIVPSEWLNLSQTDLNWTSQRIAFTLPPWLVLGNDVDISWGVIKDAISMGYNITVLVGAAIFAYKIQNIGQEPPARAEKAEKISPYGRPLVRGS